MATTTPFYYSSYDTGAPQVVANNSQSVLTMLKTCLVGSGGTAYGSKAAAGWTIPFEDDTNHAMAFKTAGGNQRYLRLGNPTNTGTSGYQSYSYFEARGYDAMTDVNTGTNPFPSTTQRSTFRWNYANQSAINTTTNIPWALMVSDRFMYLQFQAGNNGNNQGSGWGCQAAFMFGDIYSYVPGDTMQTVISGFFSGENYNVAGSPNWSANNQYFCYFPFKAADNITTFDNFMYVYGSAQQAYGPYAIQPQWNEVSGNGWAGGGGMTNPSPSGQFFFQKAYMYENSASVTLRGELPGILIPIHTRPFPDQYQLPIGSDTYVSWKNQAPLGNNSPSYNVMLNMNNWNTN